MPVDFGIHESIHRIYIFEEREMDFSKFQTSLEDAEFGGCALHHKK